MLERLKAQAVVFSCLAGRNRFFNGSKNVFQSVLPGICFCLLWMYGLEYCLCCSSVRKNDIQINAQAHNLYVNRFVNRLCQLGIKKVLVPLLTLLVDTPVSPVRTVNRLQVLQE